MRSDVRELKDDIQSIFNKDWSDESTGSAVSLLVRALDTARNCIENLYDKIDELEKDG